MMMWWLHELVKEKHDYINQSLTPICSITWLYIVHLSAQQSIILIPIQFTPLDTKKGLHNNMRFKPLEMSKRFLMIVSQNYSMTFTLAFYYFDIKRTIRSRSRRIPYGPLSRTVFMSPTLTKES